MLLICITYICFGRVETSDVYICIYKLLSVLYVMLETSAHCHVLHVHTLRHSPVYASIEL